MGWTVVVATLLLTPARQGFATCLCVDLADCGTAPQCANSRPGLDCSPPTGGVCHVAKGRTQDLTCCCGCSKRNAAAVTNCTATYAAIGLALDAVVAGPADASVCAAPAALVARGVAPTNSATPIVEKAAKKIEKKLDGARNQCEKQNANGEQKGQRGANNAADKLKDKLRRLEQRGKIGTGCAGAYGDLIDQFTTTDQPGASTTTTTTTSTTTTTLPAAGHPVVISTGFGSYPAGTHICLSRFSGAYCIFAGTTNNSCGATHIHSNGGTVYIDGADAGSDPQTTGNHCGYGVVSQDPNCAGLASYPAECP